MPQVPTAPFGELMPDLQRGLSQETSESHLVCPVQAPSSRTQRRLDMVTDGCLGSMHDTQSFCVFRCVNVWWPPLLSFYVFLQFCSRCWPVAFSGVRSPCLKTCAPSHWGPLFFWRSCLFSCSGLGLVPVWRWREARQLIQGPQSSKWNAQGNSSCR